MPAFKSILDEDDRLSFGKHQGERLGDVPEKYLAWLREQEWVGERFPALAAYLETLELPDTNGDYE